ncbi:hypothetical protein FB565_004132 [Actinoplanes lutulentus]|uniref:Secreted protein n=1 Tax=Actinoplanes lutulentus TaxID=1287878 RepID=A0A327ZJG0_9ACTN|nr:hypothetical protein [Actinoplanes lutulentus]MBB2944403.1 hypothetical protein [Actinoplanes lutulentus]RAK42365.1 hypothetical protein B0I29_102190 [Actinoplanes lutulentus]
MLQKAALLAAGAGLLVGGAVAVSPARAAPTDDRATADLVEYFASETACEDAGVLRRQYQQWLNFRCQKGQDPTAPARSPRTAWFLVRLHGAEPTPEPAAPPKLPGTDAVSDILTEKVKPAIASGTNWFCDIVFKSPCV